MNRINLALLKPGALKGSLRLPKSTLSIRPAARDTAHSRALLARCSEELYQWQSKALPADSTFVLHDGPPYANGDLHLGHALNKILKDIVGRYQILKKKPSKQKTHPTTAAEAAEAGKTMAPVELRRLAAALAHTTIDAQMAGFKSWAVLGDWDNAYRTLDRDYEVAQLRVFRDMLARGLIYRRFKPVWWSPSSGTALAEAELEYDERYASTAAFVRFPLAAGTEGASGLAAEFPGLAAAIWTTTPWTVPANRAIAVGAEMEYVVVRSAQHGYLLAAAARVGALTEFLEGETEVVRAGIPGEALAGLTYTHPLQPQQQQPIITADFVTPDSGTGLVHCAPGHGTDDYLVCLTHNIAPFTPVDANGRYTADAAPFGARLPGLQVLRYGTAAVVELLAAAGALLAVQPKYRHKYPLDWRTKQPVIVRATAQWFADAAALKARAVGALDAVRFVPEAGRARLAAFVQGRAEWCVSRQRAWGVPIPALYDAASGEPLMTPESVDHVIGVVEQRGTDAWWGDAADDEAWVPPALRGADAPKYVRGAETMDVWFDSGTSWAALRARVGERAGRPLADLVLEGSDQHRGWFQSSLLTAVACGGGDGGDGGAGQAPYGAVLTHGFCMDAAGKKMSKSLGNVVAPADIIEGRIPKAKAKAKGGGGGGGDGGGGIDALRLWVACADYTKDVSVGEAVLVHVNEALRKSRVTARFLCGNLDDWDGVAVEYEQLTKIDRYALAQLYRVNKATQEAYSNYQFNKVVNTITAYTNLDLSAFYLDVIKDRLYSDPARSLSRRSAQTVLSHVLRNYLSMLAPLVPLLTEEVWAHTPAAVTRGAASPSRLGWYRPEERWADAALVADFALIEEVHAGVRAGVERAKAAQNLKVNLESSVVIVAPDGSKARAFLEKYLDELPALFIVSGVELASALPFSSTPTSAPAKWGYASTFTLLGDACHVVVGPARGHKCVRCWVYAAEKREEEGAICARCEGTLAGYGPGEYEALFA
ncbi:tRNA synthetases class I-domain-containing protein [Morchella snyderi]|nr:tRNA synthetases class I-domain-containing protein [Morchella snyderi]